MRASKGCQSCRARHTKCVKKQGQPACTRCQESKRKCIFDPIWRFKQVEHVDTASQGVRCRTDLVYDPTQPWVPTREVIAFVNEDGTGLENDVVGIADDETDQVNDASLGEPSGTQFVQSQREHICLSHSEEPDAVQTGLVSAQTEVLDELSIEQPDIREEDRQEYLPPRRPQNLLCPSPSAFTYQGSPACSNTSLAGHLDPGTGNTRFSGNISYANSPAVNFASPSETFTPNLSGREVLLMQHFIHRLSPWLDVCDVTARFAQEVPVRATRSPMLLFSVLAASSRHQAADEGDTLEASDYHGRCLELVIQALSQPENCYDDNLLATIVCMRFYEEFDDQADSFLHLSGAARLLSTIPHFSHSGGLAEAASWQALRQDIYASLVNKQVPSFRLENYDRSSVFDRLDFGSAANVIILIFAKILRHLYTPDRDEIPITWSDLQHLVEQWNAQRAFQPSFYQDAYTIPDQPFPAIYMINAPQVVALQYYYACKVYLRLHKPVNPQYAGFEAAREQRRAEREIITPLCSIIGLAQSNAWVENANFTACHMLRTCGYCITDPLQREHSLKFLRHVKTAMRYDTQSTVDLLKHQWDDLDGLIE